MRLTERKIETLAVDHGHKDRLVFDDLQRGLAVRATASGGRTYLCQYTLHGQKWRVPLGACSGLSLAKAREAAAAVMGDVAKGRNPAADARTQRQPNGRSAQGIVSHSGCSLTTGTGFTLPDGDRAMLRKRSARCITRLLVHWTTPQKTWTGQPSCAPWTPSRGAANGKTGAIRRGLRGLQ